MEEGCTCVQGGIKSSMTVIVKIQLVLNYCTLQLIIMHAYSVIDWPDFIITIILPPVF